MIESLKRRLNGSGGHSHRQNGNGTGNNGDAMKSLPMMFENGGVTITPVVTSSQSPSSSVTSIKGPTNLLSHLLHRDNNGQSTDMATIEPIRDSSRGKS